MNTLKFLLPSVLLLIALLPGCSGDPHRKITLPERKNFADQGAKAGSVTLVLDSAARDYVIDVKGTGMRSGSRYTVFAGKALVAEAPLSLARIANSVTLKNSLAPAGTAVQIAFGDKTRLVPGQANFSASEVTIELACKVYKNGNRIWNTSVVKSNSRSSALGFCSPLLIIRKQIENSYDGAIADAASESLVQALDELNARIKKAGLKL